MNEEEIKKYKELIDKFKANDISIIGKESKIKWVAIKPKGESDIGG